MSVPTPAAPELPCSRIAHTSLIGPADRSGPIALTLVLRRRTPLPAADWLHAPDPRPHLRPHMSRDELAARHGAAQADISAIHAFARTSGLDVIDVRPAQRIMCLTGNVTAVENAFGISIFNYDCPRRHFWARGSGFVLPKAIEPLIDAVIGLDDVPGGLLPAQRLAHAPAETPDVDLTSWYRFPRAHGGPQPRVGVLVLGGGFSGDDLAAHAASLTAVPPRVRQVHVSGAGNTTSTAPYPHVVETTTNVELIATLLPDAEIVTYFAGNHERGWVEGLAAAVHDTVHRPSVMSVSWGVGERTVSPAARRVIDHQLAEAALAGITVCCAAGNVCPRLEPAGVLFPACSPWALGCGGTTLRRATDGQLSEEPWSGSRGAAQSAFFDRPQWQRRTTTSVARAGRRVPDVAAAATGHMVTVFGKRVPFEGTSASAPVWAALIAALNRALGRPVGFLNPFLYRYGPSTGAVRGERRDGAIGLGTPDGAKLLESLRPAG